MEEGVRIFIGALRVCIAEMAFHLKEVKEASQLLDQVIEASLENCNHLCNK